MSHCGFCLLSVAYQVKFYTIYAYKIISKNRVTVKQKRLKENFQCMYRFQLIDTHLPSGACFLVEREVETDPIVDISKGHLLRGAAINGKGYEGTV